MRTIFPMPGRVRGVLLALTAFPITIAATWIGWPARPRASWTEEGRLVAYSPDGRSLITDGPAGGTLRDPATGRARALLCPGHDEVSHPGQTGLRHPAFSPDGRWLVAEVGGVQEIPSLRPVLKAWELPSGRERASFEGIGPASSFQPRFVLSADGATLACKVGARPFRAAPALVRVWDLAEGEERATLPGREPLALSPDGTMLAAVDADIRSTSVTIWDVTEGEPRVAIETGLPPHRGGFGSLAFSPDGALLATTSAPGLTLWDVATGRKRLELGGQRGWPGPPWFSPDMRLLFPYGRAGAPDRIGGPFWDLSTDPPTPSSVIDLPRSCTPDLRLAVTWRRGGLSRHAEFPRDDSVVMVHDVPSMRERARFVETGVSEVRISPDGRVLAVLVDRREPVRTPGILRWLPFWSPPPSVRTSRDVREIRLLDAETGRLLGAIGLPESTPAPPDFRFSPDGKTLAVEYPVRPGDRIAPTNPPSEWTIQLWDVPPRPPIGPLVGVAAALTLPAVLIGSWFDRRRRRRVHTGISQ